MTESVHKGMSPSVERNEKPIIDKNPRKWESVLLHLVVFAFLLPTAAQSISAGLLVLSFLIPRGWRRIEWSAAIPRLFLKFLKTLAAVWGILLVAAVVEAVRTGEWNHFMPYLRMIGKQGVWGGTTIAALIYYQSRSGRSWLNPRALFVFTGLMLVYCIGQRYAGIDWVHGFHARLGENRSAYGVFRVSGWMDHPLSLAYNLMIFILLTFSQGLYQWRKGNRSEAKFWAAQTSLLFAILILTDSRYPIGLTVSVMLLGLAWDFPKIRKFLAAGAVLGLITIVAIAQGLPREALGRWGEFFDPNVALEQRFDRLIFWKVNGRLFLESPWFGTGLPRYDGRLLDTYLQAGYTGLERKYNAHNIYLQTLADGGLLGGIGLLVLLTAIACLALKVKESFHHLALPLVFIATLGSGLVQNNLRDAEYLFALWTSIGLGLSWLIVQGKRNEPRPGAKLQDNQP